MSNRDDRPAQGSQTPPYAGIGLVFGAGIGAGLGLVLGLVLLENIALGLVLGGGAGAGIGLVMGAAIDAQRRRSDRG